MIKFEKKQKINNKTGLLQSGRACPNSLMPSGWCLAVSGRTQEPLYFTPTPSSRKDKAPVSIPEAPSLHTGLWAKTHSPPGASESTHAGRSPQCRFNYRYSLPEDQR